MARYIDADILMKEFEVDTSKDAMDISDIVFGAVTSIIEKQPTADVVEVVKCKDCKYNGTSCRIMDLGSPNDFCSNGERSETE